MGGLEAVDARGASALVWATLRGQPAAVRELLSCGVSVDGVDPGATTALMAACHRPHPELVELLVQAGADVRAATGPGRRRALTYAVSRGCSQVLGNLLHAGAVSAAPHGERVALLSMAVRLGHVSALKHLLRAVPFGHDVLAATQAATKERDDGDTAGDTGGPPPAGVLRCSALIDAACHVQQQWRRRRFLLLLRVLRRAARAVVTAF